jgi:FKBP-type peptidyl-prolyl cis-trans isomerase
MTIPLMNVGEVAEVIVDGRFAYGDIGLPEKNIPPNAKVRIMVKNKPLQSSSPNSNFRSPTQ